MRGADFHRRCRNSFCRRCHRSCRGTTHFQICSLRSFFFNDAFSHSNFSFELLLIAVFEQTGIEKNASHPNAIENGPYDYTRSGNSTRDALESLLAKLDKADRALCFTSGMAALSAVSHLVQAGAFSFFIVL
ncbi:Cystathionine beta-lyase [Arachis hypogaea]|uniref:Cystathionine beta-lyase n=1 Tax=Arachis hypogaea TaxID=3818 RepID=A0A6B9VD30_ARAHY|nr:Cystathionine beta-lyase [Arachis hypogaea]